MQKDFPWNPGRKAVLPFFFFSCFFCLSAQDFTGLGRRRPLVLSGSLGTQCSSRFSADPSFSDPFSYRVDLQLNPVVYGFSMPVSLSFADSRLSYSQPFSRLSFHPSYKWVKAYLGRTSMDMHPYGLSGHPFDGAGISLQPDRFPLRFKVMYGRLSKARIPDTLPGEGDSPSASAYGRTAYAFKLDFVHKRQRVGVHFFRAVDNGNSLPERFRQLSPQGNAVLGIDFSFLPYPDMCFFGQAALSAHASDLRRKTTEGSPWEEKVFSGLLPSRPATGLSTACKLGFSFKGLRLSYERIDPGYLSMGAYYFNQDFENLVLAFSHSFSVVDFRTELGWQHDGLHRRGTGRTDRIVGSVSLNWRINTAMSTSASYSNFTSYTQMKPVDLVRPDDPFFQDPDTLPFRQVSQQAQYTFLFRSESGPGPGQEAGLDFSYQSSRLTLQEMFSDYFYASLRHALLFGDDYRLQTSLNMSACLDRQGAGRLPVRYGIGPAVILSKSFFERVLQLTGTTSYYWDVSGKKAGSGIWGVRLNASYTLKKDHRFDLGLSSRLCSVFGPEAGSSGKNRVEFQAVVGYRYRFHMDPFSGKGKKEKLGKKGMDIPTERQ